MKQFFCSVFILLSVVVYSQNEGNENGMETDKKGIDIHNVVKMSGNWFIAFRSGVSQTQADDVINHETLVEEENKFVLKRSYFTLKKDLSDVFSVRYTMDLTVDKEGSDAGNVETRLKYLYVKIKPKINSEVFTGTWLEAGMVHRPWLEYEQKINTYRVQDNMFIERNKIFNSADFGVTIGGNIGPKMDETFLKEVNGSMKGKWLSYVFGLYNGGGYSGAENNKNKVFAARLSARPLANLFPELQLSVYGNTGKGNTEASPDFNQFLGFVAYTGKHLTLATQYHFGEGDFRGIYVDKTDASKSLDNFGYSFFGEYRVPKTPLALWGRFDSFTIDEMSGDVETQRIIGGVTYRISKYLRLVLNAEHNQKNEDKNDIYELNLEVSF